MKSVTLSDLINVLTTYHKVMGDKKLMVSSDDEGNEFHTLWSTSLEKYKDGVLLGGNYDKGERDEKGYPVPVTINGLLESIVDYVYGKPHHSSSLPVYVTDDDEINGVHKIYFTISKIDDNYDDYQFHDVGLEEAKKDWLILG